VVPALLQELLLPAALEELAEAEVALLEELLQFPFLTIALAMLQSELLSRLSHPSLAIYFATDVLRAPRDCSD
jgi:hypothetical protein